MQAGEIGDGSAQEAACRSDSKRSSESLICLPLFILASAWPNPVKSSPTGRHDIPAGSGGERATNHNNIVKVGEGFEIALAVQRVLSIAMGSRKGVQ